MSEAKPDLSAFCLRARGLLAQGQVDAALGLYDDVLRIDPANAMALADRGTTYAMLQKFDLAKRDLAQAFALGYREASAFCTLATIHLEQAQPQESLRYFAQAIEIDPNYPLAYYNRSRAFHELGQPDTAIADLHKCLECNPDGNMRVLILRRLDMIRAGAADAWK